MKLDTVFFLAWKGGSSKLPQNPLHTGPCAPSWYFDQPGTSNISIHSKALLEAILSHLATLKHSRIAACFWGFHFWSALHRHISASEPWNLAWACSWARLLIAATLVLKAAIQSNIAQQQCTWHNYWSREKCRCTKIQTNRCENIKYVILGAAGRALRLLEIGKRKSKEGLVNVLASRHSRGMQGIPTDVIK